MVVEHAEMVAEHDQMVEELAEMVAEHDPEGGFSDFSNATLPRGSVTKWRFWMVVTRSSTKLFTVLPEIYGSLFTVLTLFTVDEASRQTPGAVCCLSALFRSGLLQTGVNFSTLIVLTSEIVFCCDSTSQVGGNISASMLTYVLKNHLSCRVSIRW